MMKLRPVSIAIIALPFGLGFLAYAQSTSANSGTVRGSVLDPSGAAIAGATLEIQNPVSHYHQKTQADSQGKFELDNIPFNNYHLIATASGFQNGTQDVDVRSPIPFELKMSLKIGSSTTTVVVEGAQDHSESSPLAMRARAAASGIFSPGRKVAPFAH